MEYKCELIEKFFYIEKGEAWIMKFISAIINRDCRNCNPDKNEYIEKNNQIKKLNERITLLEKELMFTKECLQTSIKESEISREELKIAHEELLVYNEELQTTNEEIQAANEELRKINTQYKNKNQELADLYNDMTNYLNSTDIGTIFLDENLCIREFTPPVTAVINLKTQDIGRPMEHITCNLMNDELNMAVREVIKRQMPSEKEVQSKNGSWYLLKCAPYLTIENTAKGVVVSLVDITKRKNAEIETFRSKEKYAEKVLSESLKTEFFSNISHELRTPLNVILCTLQLLESYSNGNYTKDKEISFKKYINIMKQNSLRQLRLVNNLLDITKLDSGFLELNLMNCNIINVVESVAMSVAEYIKNNSIKLIFDTDIEEAITACDPEKIERIILNLISNSIKFTKEGGSIYVNIYDKGESIIISIKDTGIGIPKEKLDIIFDRFRQVDKSLTRTSEGTGIGLSIVKSLVELHNGKISVSSEYGKGSEFIIELPITVLPDEKVIHRAIEAESQERIDKINVEFSDIYSLS